MIEPNTGDIIIMNDLIGVVCEVDSLNNNILLNTIDGQKNVSFTENTAVIATAEETAKFCAQQIIKEVWHAV